MSGHGRHRRAPVVLAVVLPVQFGLAALAWRDIARRPPERLRGSKTAWRVIVSLNPGNAGLYWLLGRR